MTDIITSDLVTRTKEHVSDLYKQYRQILKTLLDKHAPIKSKSATPKQLWKCIDQILYMRPAPSLLTHASIKSLCNSFPSHFKDKISLTHSAFTDNTPDIVNADSPQLNPQLASFEPATTAEVRKIIMLSPSKFCDLDPLPAIGPTTESIP